MNEQDRQAFWEWYMSFIGPRPEPEVCSDWGIKRGREQAAEIARGHDSKLKVVPYNNACRHIAQAIEEDQ